MPPCTSKYAQRPYTFILLRTNQYFLFKVKYLNDFNIADSIIVCPMDCEINGNKTPANVPNIFTLIILQPRKLFFAIKSYSAY